MIAVLAREIRSYFQTLTGFLFLGLFLLFAGIIFTLSNLWPPGSTDFRVTLTSLNLVFLIVVPILTMRLLSEEARQKTDQLLLTSPLSIPEIVLGKYLAALALFTVALGVTALFPALLGTVGLVVRTEIFSAYLGVYLLGACLIAIGLLVSSLTDNPVSASLLTFGAILLIWTLDWIIPALPRERGAGLVFLLLLSVLAGFAGHGATRSLWAGLGTGALAAAAVAIAYAARPSLFDGLVVHVFLWFSLVARYGSFSRGVIAAGPIFYYLSFCALFLYLTVRVVDRRRWA